MAQVVVTMESDVAKLIRDQERVIKRQEEMIAKFRATGGAAKSAGDDADKGGKKAQEAWGPKLSGMVTSAVSQFASVTVAINLVTDALRFMQEETDKAKASFDRLADSRRRLTQVATSAEDLQQLEDRADQLAEQFGVDREIVREVIFSARSEGFEDVVDEIIASARVAAPQAAAGVAGQIPSLFPDADLSPLEALNATLVAAQRSRLNFEQIAASLPAAAEGAAMAGASPAETFALEAVLASRFKSGETAADRIKAFGTFVSLTPELAGEGILAAVEQISAMSEEQRAATLGGSAEVNVAFTAISEEMAAIREQQRIIEEEIRQSGTEQSAFARGRQRAFDPSTRQGRTNQAAQEAERSRIARELAAERAMAEGGFQREAAINQVVAERQAAGDALGAFGAQRAGEVAELVGVDEEGAGLAAQTGAAGVEASIPLLALYRNARRFLFPQGPGAATNQADIAPGTVTVPQLPDLASPAGAPSAGRLGSAPAATVQPQDGGMNRSARDLSQAARELEQAAARLGNTATTRPAFSPRQRAATATNPE